jgi:hypothetical protein
LVPVINSHGMATLPKACAGAPFAGSLGLKAIAALIRAVGEQLAAAGRGLSAHRLGGDRAERMAAHADALEVQPAGKRMILGVLPERELVEHGGNILDAQQEVRAGSRVAHRALAFKKRLVFPHPIVAAGVLEKDGGIAAGGPVAAQISGTLPVATETVAEQDDRCGGLGGADTPGSAGRAGGWRPRRSNQAARTASPQAMPRVIRLVRSPAHAGLGRFLLGETQAGEKWRTGCQS